MTVNFHYEKDSKPIVNRIVNLDGVIFFTITISQEEDSATDNITIFFNNYDELSKFVETIKEQSNSKWVKDGQ